LPVHGARPTRGPRAGTAAGSAETTLRLAGDHDRIPGELNDLVAGRLFSAGLDLEAARGLFGEHRAAGRIEYAVSELDLAIRDIGDMVFGSRRAGSPAARKPGQGGRYGRSWPVPPRIRSTDDRPGR
jgi:hypothetical protein